MRSAKFVCTLCLLAAASLVPAAVSPALAQTDFVDALDSFDTSLWQKSDGWTNGLPFDCGWRADHVGFAGGVMSLTLDDSPCPSGCSGVPYASAEYRTAVNYGYGRIEGRFKAAQGSGVMAGSLFTY